jgi:hypothetical protein
VKQLIIILSVYLSAFSQNIHQELIIGGYHEIKNAEAQLVKLDIYFMENSVLDVLKKRYRLKTKIRRIGEYEVVSIEPIDSIALKNRLLIKLNPFFPNIFFIDSKLPVTIQKERKYGAEKAPQNPTSTIIIQKEKDIIDQMGLQWFAILMLSIAGLILSVFRRNKVHYLQKIQKVLGTKQDQIEKEIKHMEDVHA